jgi:hypothetical protein
MPGLVLLPKCRYKTHRSCHSGKGKRSCRPPFPSNNPITLTKKLKKANENAARSFLCRIYLHRFRFWVGGKKTLLTVNPAETCSKMNQFRMLPKRANGTFVLEVPED